MFGREYHRHYFFHAANRVKPVRKDGRSEVFKAGGGCLNEFGVVAGEIRGGPAQSPLVPPGAAVDVMELPDERRRQMKPVYPFEKAEP